MKYIARILLALLGVLVIIATLSGGIGYGRGSVSFFLGLALGGGLIVAPFTAFGMLLMYLLMLVFIIGFPILGAYIGAQITGKNSIGVWVGLIGVGFKIATGDYFETLMTPIRKVTEQDDKE